MTEREALISYTSSPGPLSGLTEWRNLVRLHRSGLESRVEGRVAELGAIEQAVLELTGMKIEHCRILDIGPGQQLMQMAYFATRGNDVLGVDRDTIVQGLDPAGYWRMARSNGIGRLVKTVGRKALRVDYRFRKEFERQLGLSVKGPRLTVYQRNAWETRLEDESFDFVYSLRTFAHIHRPAAALDEVVRVLAPGGAVFIHIMPFTGPWGSLDIRTVGGSDELPPWAHLRPEYEGNVKESAHLNRLSAAQWRNIVTRAMPGCSLEPLQQGAEELRPLAEKLHEQGELVEFELDDLVTTALHIVWQKPAG
jgi:SAM-dependent methyltransferase